MANLLLVDDSLDLGLIVGMVARRAGHRLEHRLDVPSAWQALEQAVPDLVLLDVNLPGECGLELCRRARAKPALACAPVALFCQPELRRDVAAGLEAGADFLVSKELVRQPPDLQRRLDEVLAWSHGRRPPGLLRYRQGPLSADRQERLPQDGADRLRRAVDGPLLRLAGSEALPILLRRAQSSLGAALSVSWLFPCGGAPGDGATLRDLGPEQLACLLNGLVEQAWCLVGTEALVPFTDALALVAREWALESG
jgi:CheY-like chemotaxis protein